MDFLHNPMVVNAWISILKRESIDNLYAIKDLSGDELEFVVKLAIEKLLEEKRNRGKCGSN